MSDLLPKETEISTKLKPKDVIKELEISTIQPPDGPALKTVSSPAHSENPIEGPVSAYAESSNNTNVVVTPTNKTTTQSETNKSAVPQESSEKLGLNFGDNVLNQFFF